MPRSLVFLPGLLENALVFEAQAEALRGLATTSVADLAGDDSIAAMARTALEQAPKGPLCIAGHSMGGYVALEMVRQAPERIDRLALICTNARPDSPESTENRRRLMALAQKNFTAAATALTPKLLLEAHLGNAAMTGVIEQMASDIGADAFMRQQRAMIARIDSRPHLAAIACPTLVVAARHDAIMPVPLLEEMAHAIPGAHLALIEDSGHVPMIEQPAQVTAALAGWLG